MNVEQVYREAAFSKIMEKSVRMDKSGGRWRFRPIAVLLTCAQLAEQVQRVLPL